MPWSRPAARLRELVTAVRAIWDAWDGTAPLDFRGSSTPTPSCRPPSTRGRPSTAIPGSASARSVPPHPVAAEVADGILVHPFATRASLTGLTLPTIAEGLAGAGRDRSRSR